MKHVSDLLNVVKTSPESEPKQLHHNLNPLSIKLVEYVFAKFYILCRGADSLFSDPKRLLAEKTQWQATFTRSNYTTTNQICKALLQLEKHTFPNPPQLGEFLKWNESTPEDLGLITKEKAYRIAYCLMRGDNVAGLSKDAVKLVKLAVEECGPFFP